jgi:hypothetical protein
MNRIYYWLLDKANTFPYLVSLISSDIEHDSNISIHVEYSLLISNIDTITDIFLDLVENGYVLGIKVDA